MSDKYPKDGGLIHTEPPDIDIVERLREDARGGMAYIELSDEAADEIERLRAALQALMLDVMNNTHPSLALNHAIAEARRALEPKP